MNFRSNSILLHGAAWFLAAAATSNATPLPGTVLLNPAFSVLPGALSPATATGLLLASLTMPFSFTTTAGTTSGTLRTAVYRNPTGTLDFYYQVTNSPGSATALVRETATDFQGFQTFLGYRFDAFGPFVTGTVSPAFAEENLSGSVVGFGFSPINLPPGQTTYAYVISTNARDFTAGNASLIDGGTQTLAAFQPTAVPEPEPLALLGGGALTLIACRRKLWLKGVRNAGPVV